MRDKSALAATSPACLEIEVMVSEGSEANTFVEWTTDLTAWTIDRWRRHIAMRTGAASGGDR